MAHTIAGAQPRVSRWRSLIVGYVLCQCWLIGPGTACRRFCRAPHLHLDETVLLPGEAVVISSFPATVLCVFVLCRMVFSESRGVSFACGLLRCTPSTFLALIAVTARLTALVRSTPQPRLDLFIRPSPPTWLIVTSVRNHLGRDAVFHLIRWDTARERGSRVLNLQFCVHAPRSCVHHGVIAASLHLDILQCSLTY